jgi:uncharacterized membrane protein YidH (DUF202 family)
MSEFWGDIRVQQLTMLLAVSFAIALVIFGIIIRRSRFLDIDKTSDKSFSRSLSTVILSLAMIIGIVAILGLVLTFFI